MDELQGSTLGKARGALGRGKKPCSAELLEIFGGVSNHINKGNWVAAACLGFQKTRLLTKRGPKMYVLRDLGVQVSEEKSFHG